MATLAGMLSLPESELVTPIAQAHLKRFTDSGIAEELRGDTHTWTLASWPRVEGYPARFILRSDAFEEVEVTFHDAKSYTTRRRERPRGLTPRMRAAS